MGLSKRPKYPRPISTAHQHSGTVQITKRWGHRSGHSGRLPRTQDFMPSCLRRSTGTVAQPAGLTQAKNIVRCCLLVAVAPLQTWRVAGSWSAHEKSSYIRRYILARHSTQARKKHLGFLSKCLIHNSNFGSSTRARTRDLQINRKPSSSNTYVNQTLYKLKNFDLLRLNLCSTYYFAVLFNFVSGEILKCVG